MASPPVRPTVAEIDLGAIAHNVAAVAKHVRPAAVNAVIKADGYGHGAAAVGIAAMAAGATGLAVALVEEGELLRQRGLSAPVLVLAEPVLASKAAAERVVAARLTATVYSAEWIEALDRASRRAGTRTAVQIKLDTGMHRVGARPEHLGRLLDAVEAGENLDVGGVFTHFACADDPTDPFTGEQIDRFEAACSTAGYLGHRHLANSAGALWHPRSWADSIRLGVSLYGIAPARGPVVPVGLAPALRFTTAVAWTVDVAEGEGVSYGLRWRATRPTTVGVLPVGYADGLPRSLGSAGLGVLINGVRCPIVGAVTMDQTLVDLTPALRVAPVTRGAEVVLLGQQGAERIDPWDWAELTGTIAYEPVATIGSRVPRRYVGPSTSSAE